MFQRLQNVPCISIFRLFLMDFGALQQKNLFRLFLLYFVEPALTLAVMYSIIFLHANNIQNGVIFCAFTSKKCSYRREEKNT